MGGLQTIKSSNDSYQSDNNEDSPLLSLLFPRNE